MLRALLLVTILPRSLFPFANSLLLSNQSALYRGLTSSLVVFSVNANSQEQTFISSNGSSDSNMGHYRKDGVKIDHDPYAKGMAEKYGLRGNSDPEGTYFEFISVL
jgi:hypothetical protein